MGYLDKPTRQEMEAEQQAVKTPVVGSQTPIQRAMLGKANGAVKAVGADGPDSGQANPYAGSVNPNLNEIPAYQKRDFSGALPEFDYLRKKATEQANSQGQEADDAIQRKFASMGMLNSGQYLKQSENLQAKLAEQKASSLEGIGFQEAQARRGLEEQEQGRAFQSQEAQSQRQFQSGESLVNRQAQAWEAQAGRSQQDRLATMDKDFKEWAANLSNDTALKQLEIEQNKLTTAQEESLYNIAENEKTRGNPKGIQEIVADLKSSGALTGKATARDYSALDKALGVPTPESPKVPARDPNNPYQPYSAFQNSQGGGQWEGFSSGG